jgi:cytidyltransferase-like protein
MKTFKQLIESLLHPDTAVLTYGRMNPPTIGHAKLIDHVLKQTGHHHIVVSHSQDTKKNPLSGEEKVDLLKKMYPKHHESFHSSDSEHPTIFHHAALLHKQGFKHLHVVVGSDRVDEFKKSLTKYNGKFNKDGQGYDFKSIKVSSAGDRDPDGEGVEGMSASKMREHALNGRHEEFRAGLHPALHTVAHEIMHKIKSRMK